MNLPLNFYKLQSRVVPRGTVVAAAYPCKGRDRLYVGVAKGSEGEDRVVQWAMPVGAYTQSVKYCLKWPECPDGQDSIDVPHMVPLWDAYVEGDHVYLKSPLRVTVSRLFKSGVGSPPRGHAYKKRQDKFKMETNIRLARLGARAALKCLIDNSIPTGALYLDSAEASTTQALVRHGNYREVDLYTPNDDPNVCKTIKTKFPRVNAPVTTIENFISKSTTFFSYVWIDGMGTWKGNLTLKRSTRLAIRRLFHAKQLATHAVVAYTISLRGQPGRQEDSARREMVKNHQEVMAWARKAGYTVSRPNIVHLPRNMVTIAFSSFKDVDASPCIVG